GRRSRMTAASLLDQHHLSVISNAPDSDLDRIRDTIVHKAVVGGRDDLEMLLCQLLAQPCGAETPKTLDLIAQTATDASLLVLGSWLVDLSSRVVSSYFRELVEHNVMPRLGIHAVRLLGSLTADARIGQWTICALSDLLGVEVYGTRN